MELVVAEEASAIVVVVEADEAAEHQGDEEALEIAADEEAHEDSAVAVGLVAGVAAADSHEVGEAVEDSEDEEEVEKARCHLLHYSVRIFRSHDHLRRFGGLFGWVSTVKFPLALCTGANTRYLRIVLEGPPNHAARLGECFPKLRA